MLVPRLALCLSFLADTSGLVSFSILVGPVVPPESYQCTSLSLLWSLSPIQIHLYLGVVSVVYEERRHASGLGVHNVTREFAHRKTLLPVVLKVVDVTSR